VRDACGETACSRELFRATQGLLGFASFGGVAAVKNDAFPGLRINVELKPGLIAGGGKELLELNRDAFFHGTTDVGLYLASDQVRIKVP